MIFKKDIVAGICSLDEDLMSLAQRVTELDKRIQALERSNEKPKATRPRKYNKK